MMFNKPLITYLLSLLILVFSSNIYSIEVSQGSLVTLTDFKSNYVSSRDVHVWLPDNYHKKSQQGKKFAVLYMHDGQMLFDAQQTWNKQEWGVDETASALIKQNKVRPFIVVGINNGGAALRHPEYFPQKPFESLLPQKQQSLYQAEKSPGYLVFGGNKVQSDNYLKFIVKELKPYIDTQYKVLKDAANTYIMGSSMGGLISMYAISEYPEVFGAAACLSTHWPGDFSALDDQIPNAFYRYMKNNLPEPKTHRIYFDYGTETLDALYPRLQQQVDKIIKARGYSDSNWITNEFKGANHTENAWNERLHLPLLFLFGL